MRRRAIWALVPVKPFGLAKRRLAPLLDPPERDRVARAMLADVLEAATGARALAGTLVVTADAAAAVLAGRFGASVLAEIGARGPNAAVEAGLAALRAVGAEGVVVIPADIPHITPAAIDAASASCRQGRSVVLVPASRDGGTNLLALAPPNVIAPRFGESSFRRHLEAAKAAGIEPVIACLGDLDLDIDRPEDVAAFLRLQSPTRTQRLLVELGVPSRLGDEAAHRQERPLAPAPNAEVGS